VATALDGIDGPGGATVALMPTLAVQDTPFPHAFTWSVWLPALVVTDAVREVPLFVTVVELLSRE